MEQDRSDLVTAIVKLKDSINELNKKGRERLIEAFEKVNRKYYGYKKKKRKCPKRKKTTINQ